MNGTLSSFLRYLGYLVAAVRVAWLLKGLWARFLALAADAGNAWTDKCFTRAEWEHMSDEGWDILVAASIVCPVEAVKAIVAKGHAQQRRLDQTVAPQRVEWPENSGHPWDSGNAHRKP